MVIPYPARRIQGRPTAPTIFPAAALLTPPPVPMDRTARPGGYPAGYTGAPPSPWAQVGDAVVGGLSNNSNALIGLGMGLLSRPRLSDAVAAAGQGWMQGNATDLQRSDARRQLETAESAKANTIAALQAMGDDPLYAQLAEGVQSGAIPPGDAFNQGVQFSTQARKRDEDLARAKGNAAFLTDPDLKAMVESGTIPFKDAYDIQRGNQPKPTNDIINFEYARDHPGFADNLAQQDGTDPSEIEAITDAIISGQQPPTLNGMYGNTVHVRAALAKRNYDLTKATQDFKATERLLSSMNGPQQLRLRQAVTFTKDSLETIEQLAQEWNGGQFPLLNWANLQAAKNGVYGQDAASLATRLESQVNDMTSELATVYKGGNSSTDESLRLAASNLKSDWSKDTLLDAVKQIRTSLTYRENSINLVGTAGFPDSQYNPMGNEAPAVPGAGPDTPPLPAPTGAVPPGTPTATNPQTGQKIMLVNGQWVPVQ